MDNGYENDQNASSNSTLISVCVHIPEITQKGVGESVMVCNRSEWLQNRKFPGTILPMKTMKAAKKCQ